MLEILHGGGHLAWSYASGIVAGGLTHAVGAMCGLQANTHFDGLQGRGSSRSRLGDTDVVRLALKLLDHELTVVLRKLAVADLVAVLDCHVALWLIMLHLDQQVVLLQVLLLGPVDLLDWTV